ncbi:DDB1- AND CUL4-ASSOCIATED FACTOR 11 [Salix purpurea]|uniref:DDB1- AND CUL4-ASSOCIATED FACTOR 11 n=1 Tax=Salix purpurea TaxID=77065 RepID=A0A9Q0SK07_SALPP|nr:DDB1- AND CUL4-ASSOCIATED FACTOR 11 [Salix purpurea]
MGYAMSRLEMDSELCDGDKTMPEAGSSKRASKSLNKLDHEIAQVTKLNSSPHKQLAKLVPGTQKLSVSPVKMLVGREANYSARGRFSAADRCHMLSRYLPVKGPWLVDQMSTRAYVSQFSADGSLFVAGFQGSYIRIYNVEDGWKVQKNILAKSLRWTVTDTSLSPDQRHLVYASMSPIVHIVDVGSAETESLANVTEFHDGLDFSSSSSDGSYSFGIFSVKFSTDGRELVAGSSDDSIYVYDLEQNKLSLKILAHTPIGSSTLGHLGLMLTLYVLLMKVATFSFLEVMIIFARCGIDAALLRKGKPAGVLSGHLEGITFIDSRGDGRYFISNGKDQTIKLWDIRKMAPNATSYSGLRNYEWDYRWMDYPYEARDLKHPSDQSIATYKGHSVLRTLIRCYFSPVYSTGQKYIYTGSHDSCVYIYDLVTGEQVASLQHHKSTVRDCSWHPYYPMLVSSSWDGDVIKWEFPCNGEAQVPATKKRIRRQ